MSVNAQMEQDRCYALVAVILAVNFNRSKVFLFFFCGWVKNILLFSCASRIYDVYLYQQNR